MPKMFLEHQFHSNQTQHNRKIKSALWSSTHMFTKAWGPEKNQNNSIIENIFLSSLDVKKI